MKSIKKVLTVGSSMVLAVVIAQCDSNNINNGDMGSLPAPTITSIAPSSGINNAPTSVTITGTNFRPGATVTIGGQICANPSVATTQITCTVPVRTATCAAQDAVITNSDAQTTTKTGGFTYYTALTTFAAAPTPTVATGMNPRRVISADLNSDGKLDLVSPNAASDNVSVLINNGDGTFKAASNLTTAGAVSPVDATAGDVNGDRKLDLVVINSGSSNYTVYLGNGDGTFNAGTNTNAGLLSPITMALGDLNGDLKLDLISGSSGATIGTAIGNGDGTFKAPTITATGGKNAVVALGDLNGDGRIDVVSTGFDTNNASVLLGNGDGTFMPFTNGGATGVNPFGVAIADINADQKLDLMIANNGVNTVSLLLGNGDGTFKSQTTVNTGGSNPLTVIVTDMNGDGIKDIVVSNSASWSVIPGMGNGQFGTVVNTVFGSQTTGMTVADLNGDKLPDVAVASLLTSVVGIFLQQCK